MTKEVNCLCYDRKLQRAEEILTIEITKKTEIFSTFEIKTSEKVFLHLSYEIVELYHR